MRRAKRSGNFIFILLLNMMLNLEGLIPAAILLALHFFLHISIWWGIGAFCLWILYLLIWMWILSWTSKSSNTPDKPKVNKNPYSSGPYVSIAEKNKDD